ENSETFDSLPRKLEREQFHASFFSRCGSTNNPDEFIQICERNKVTFESFSPFLGLLQFEASPAHHHFAPMLDVAIDQLFEIERFWPAVIDSEGVDRKTGLELRELIEIIDDDLGDGVALELNDHARILVGFVANGCDVADDLLVDQLGNPL